MIPHHGDGHASPSGPSAGGGWWRVADEAGPAQPAARRHRAAVPRRGKIPTHHSHQQSSPRMSGPAAGTRPSRRPLVGRGRCRKSTVPPPPMPAPRRGAAIMGQAAAKSSPTSVPGMVISSGMIFSSASISDAASIKSRAQHVRGELPVQNGKPSGPQRSGNVRRQQAPVPRPPTSTATPARCRPAVPAAWAAPRNPAPCRAASRRSPSQPKMGSRSQMRRGGADRSGRDQGLIARGYQARR